MATGGLELGTSQPKVLGFTTVPVRFTKFQIQKNRSINCVHVFDDNF